MSINTVEIETVLERLALNNASRFNAYYVSYLSNQAEVDLVNDYLLMKAKFGALKVKVETICPNNHVDSQFDISMDLPEYEIECRFCDEEEAEYYADPECTNVVYFFTDSFVDNVKKKDQSSDRELSEEKSIEVGDMPFYTYKRLKEKSNIFVIVENGGTFMAKNDFGGVEIKAQNSAIGLGSGNNITNNNQSTAEIIELTENLLKLLEKEDIPEDQKNELNETIVAVAENANGDKPNKTLLKGLTTGLKGTMDAFIKSPALIEAYTKWSTFIAGLL